MSGEPRHHARRSRGHAVTRWPAREGSRGGVGVAARRRVIACRAKDRGAAVVTSKLKSGSRAVHDGVNRTPNVGTRWSIAPISWATITRAKSCVLSFDGDGAVLVSGPSRTCSGSSETRGTGDLPTPRAGDELD